MIAETDKNRFSLLYCVTLCVLAGVTASNASAATWYDAQVGSYRIVSGMSKKTTEAVARNIQTYQTALRIVFPKGDPDPHIPVTLFLLDGRTWTTLFPDLPNQPYQASVTGLTFVRDDHMYMLIDGGSWGDAARIAYHEMTHVFLHKNFNSHRLPVFLDEGYAEFLSTLDATDTAVKVGRPVAQRYYSLRSDKWVPLAELLSASRSSPSYAGENQVLVFYAQSWLLVHYMAFANPARRKQIDEYVNELALGKDPQAALSKVFTGDSLKVFEKELIAYSERKGFEYWTIPSAELAKSPPVSITELPWQQVSDEIGNWLVRRTRYLPSHVKFLQKRHADQPVNELAAIQLARAYAYSKRIDEATALVEKTCTDQLRAAHLRYQCAETYLALNSPDKESSEGEPTTSSDSSIDKHSKYFLDAVRQEPDNLTFLLRAAVAAAPSAEDSKIITAGLLRAHQRDQFNFGVAHQLAIIYRDTDIQRAKYFATRAVYCAPNPTALNEASDLLKELNDRSPEK